ncbi:unnamed protein product [Sphagnum balticum]
MHPSSIDSQNINAHQPESDQYIMVRKGKYSRYLKQCNDKNELFTDPEFIPGPERLNFVVPGREIVWKRITDIVPGCVMVEDDITPQDIH